MAGLFAVEKENRHSCDPFLLSVIFLLTGIGLTFLFSASYPNAIRLNREPEFFLFRQAVMVAAGLAGAVILMNLSLIHI